MASWIDRAARVSKQSENKFLVAVIRDAFDARHTTDSAQKKGTTTMDTPNIDRAITFAFAVLAGGAGAAIILGAIWLAVRT